VVIVDYSGVCDDLRILLLSTDHSTGLSSVSQSVCSLYPDKDAGVEVKQQPLLCGRPSIFSRLSAAHRPEYPVFLSYRPGIITIKSAKYLRFNGTEANSMFTSRLTETLGG